MCDACWDEDDAPEFDWGDDGHDAEPDPYDYDDDPIPYNDSPEPNCLVTGCYDSGFTRRGRRCPGCNPSRWQRIFYGARWHVVIRPWLWLDRKFHPRRSNGFDESPF